jgi:hypothetical protein
MINISSCNSCKFELRGVEQVCQSAGISHGHHHLLSGFRTSSREGTKGRGKHRPGRGTGASDGSDIPKCVPFSFFACFHQFRASLKSKMNLPF